MRLLVDLQACQGPSADRGIGYYALSLARALAEGRGDREVLVLLDGAAEPSDVLHLRHRLGPAVRSDDVVLFPSPPPAVRAHATEEAAASREAAIAALAPDAVLITSVFELGPHAPMTISQWCPGVPTAAVLHDLIPLLDLDLYKADLLLRREYLAGLDQLQAADLLLTNSDYSAREAKRLLAQCPPLVTIHGGAPPAALARPPRRAPEPGFALAVARDEPRKDVATAVLAWAALTPEVRAGRPFVVVGEWPEENRLRLRQLAGASGLPSTDIVFMGPSDDHELAWLYANAELFVFPSLVEGLGLPPLEAMQAGTPVLLARTSALVELVDDPAAYFSPGDVEGLSRLMAGVLTDPDARQHLLDVGAESLKRFTWARTAERAWSALADLAARHDQRPTPPRSLAVLDRRDRAAEGDDLAALLDGHFTAARRPRWSSTDGAPPWWSVDRVLYVLHDDQDWDAHGEALAEAPGVVLVPRLPSDGRDVATVLAPALAAVVPSTEVAVDLVRAGATSTPVHVVPDRDVAGLAAAIEAAYAADVAGRWAAAVAGVDVPANVAEHLVRPPAWSRRPRGPVVASDVTIYRATPFFSGIQRATRHIHDALTPLLAVEGGAVVPTVLGDSPPDPAHPDIARDPVLAVPTVPLDEADWMIGIDLNALLRDQTGALLAARANGTRVAVYVHDLLPHFHPEWWPAGSTDASFRPWIRAAAAASDLLLVNSMATATDLERFVTAHPPRRTDGFAVQLLRLGADFEHVAPAGPVQREGDHFLMVGTIEPRKGHRDVLDAFEELWAGGEDARLTFLGRAGWMVDELVERMERVAARRPQFRWLRNADDATLDGLYRTVTATIVASEGEGFGLPVVEAALRRCPVVVRDIPVMREVSGDGATWFDGGTRPLARVLRDVLAAPDDLPQVPLSQLVSWSEVGQRLHSILRDEVEPVARWSPESGWSWT